MIHRYPRILTTVEEDFRKIGLLPPLNEGKQLSEVDDPAKPRDIPSPEPSTLPGLDTSGGDKSANHKTAKQPKPAMGPDDDDSAVMDPIEDGGSKGAHKSKGSYHKVPGGKEASIKGENKGYMLAKKNVHPKGKGKGQAPAVAQGLKPAKKIGGMSKTSSRMESVGTLGKAATLIEEVTGLLRGVQIDEAVDNLMRGFRLVSEDAALLADRLTEMADVYHVEKLVSEMEELSRAAAEAIDIVETEMTHVGDDGDENAAIKNSAADEYEHVEDMDETEEESAKDHDPEKPYDIPSPAFKEQAEKVFSAMVDKLMDALEAYDSALDEGEQEEGALGTAVGAGLGAMAGGPVGAAAGGALGHAATDDEDEEDPRMADDGQGDEDGQDGEEGGAHVHIHHHSDVHHHHHAEGDGAEGDGEDGGEDGMAAGGDDDGMDDRDPDHDGDDDTSPEGDTDGDRQDMMAKMHALKSKRDSMMGGHKAPFRKGEEEGAY
jgi:hypothetical protein